MVHSSIFAFILDDPAQPKFEVFIAIARLGSMDAVIVCRDNVTGSALDLKNKKNCRQGRG